MKSFIISMITASAIIGSALFFMSSNETNLSPSVVASNVSIVEGTQIIEISAKGGYSPQLSSAQANIPTVIRMTTQGTFDCSSALSIPSLGYRTNLPPSGVTDIEIPPQTAGTTVQGLCSMGMFNFAVQFN